MSDAAFGPAATSKELATGLEAAPLAAVRGPQVRGPLARTGIDPGGSQRVASRSRLRAITICWIWLVPSYRRNRRTSR